jgi:hypothetical protein
MNVGFNDYDYGFGIDAEAIDYTKESIEILSRVSPVKCFVLFQNTSGSNVGESDNRITISDYSEVSPAYRAVIWASGSNHPDTRTTVNNGQGAIWVYIDNAPADRILEVEDIQSDTEFAVVKRADLIPSRVELVFNSGFNATLHTIQYYYTTAEEGSGDDDSQRGGTAYESVYGWHQYLNYTPSPFRSLHQVLIRMPLTKRDLIINSEGRVRLEDNQSWMIWEPYINDGDVIIVPPEESISGEEERYEVIDKQDSAIQGSLITQRFKLSLLEDSDSRYKISYIR